MESNDRPLRQGESEQGDEKEGTGMLVAMEQRKTPGMRGWGTSP